MSETRQHIITLADELIRTKGFNAFSYSDIAAPLDIRNAAVHYHFPSKSDLGIAVVDAELQRIAAYRQKYGAVPGERQLQLLVEAFQRSNKLHLICLMGSLTPDYDTFDPPLQQKVRQMCGIILDWITLSLENARSEQRLRFEGRAEDRALLFISTLQSSLLLARAMGNRDIFGRMLDQLLIDMGASWRTKRQD